MIGADPRLLSRVIGWQIVFSLGTSALAALAPRLMQLEGAIEEAAIESLLQSIALGGALTTIFTWWSLSRHRYLLRALAMGSRWVDLREMEVLTAEIGRSTAAWVVPPVLGFAVGATLLRPAIMDLTTALSLAFLGSVIVAAASLPLHIVIRAAFLKTMELGSPQVLGELVRQAEARGLPRRRLTLRLVAALATPVAFSALGAALITSAHLREADTRQRSTTAREVTRAALVPGESTLDVDGLDAAVQQFRQLGFSAVVQDEPATALRVRDENGVVELTVPLERGSARVRLIGSLVGVVTPDLLLTALLAIAVAGVLGVTLGRALADDLHIATLSVRALSQENVSASRRLLQQARFRVVGELGRSIERLALRFRLFARAQRRAIESREAASRTRGLFFASVSHDLKSPLNAILGFTDLVRQQEPVTVGQAESLDLIERSGRELLALIETILDAARVEAGQLTLLKEAVKMTDLFRDAVDTGKHLGGARDIAVVGEISEGTPPVDVDPLRIGRVVATFVGHALRTSDQSPVWLRAAPADDGLVHVEVEFVSDRVTALQLESLIDARKTPGMSEHRGLALSLSLARSVAELHGGSVHVEEREGRAVALCIDLPAARE